MAFHVATLSPCSRWVAGGGERGHIVIWTLQETNENTTTRFYAEIIIENDPQSRIRALVFSPDNTLLVSGAANHDIQVWDTREGTSMWQMQAEELGNYRHSAKLTFQDHDSFLLTGRGRKGGTWTVARMWKKESETAVWSEANWQEHVVSDEMGDEETSEPEEPDLQWTSNGRILTAREIGDEDVHSKPAAIYFHKATITAILERDVRVIIGDRLGGVAFLTLRNTDTPVVGGAQALIPIPAFANAPRCRVQSRFSFEKGKKLFDIDAIRHVGYTVLVFKKSVLQQLNIDPSAATPRDWRVLL